MVTDIQDDLKLANAYEQPKEKGNKRRKSDDDQMEEKEINILFETAHIKKRSVRKTSAMRSHVEEMEKKLKDLDGPGPPELRKYAITPSKKTQKNPFSKDAKAA